MSKLETVKTIEFNDFVPNPTDLNETVLSSFPYEFSLSTLRFEDLEQLFNNDDDNRTSNAYTYSNWVARSFSTEQAQDFLVDDLPFKIVPGVRIYDPEQIQVEGFDRGTNHLLSIFADSWRNAGIDEDCIRAGLMVLLEYQGKEVGLSEEQKRIAHTSYCKSIEKEARNELVRITGNVDEYAEILRTKMTDQAHLPDALKKLSKLKYRLVDQLQFKLEKMTDVPSYVSDKEIDTLQSPFEGKSGFGVAAQYRVFRHRAEFQLAKYDEETQKIYVFHEIGHALSTLEYQELGEDELRVRRVGFHVTAASARLETGITMHGAINEGFNDRRARLMAGLDALGYGSYEQEREIVEHLLCLTGSVLLSGYDNAKSDVERQNILKQITEAHGFEFTEYPIGISTATMLGEHIWNAYYDATSREERQAAYGTITRTLAKAGGPGLLNRIDTTRAVYGSEYVLELLDQSAYEDFEYIRPLEISERIKEVQSESIEIEIDDLETASFIIREPMPDRS